MTHQPNDHIAQAELDRLEQAGHPEPGEFDEARHESGIQVAQPSDAEWKVIDSGVESFAEVKPGHWQSMLTAQAGQPQRSVVKV